MLLAVTGTDGKTTTAHMARTILSRLGSSATTVGTLGVGHDRGWDPLPPGTGRRGSMAAVLRLYGHDDGHDHHGREACIVEAPSAWLARGVLDGLQPTVAALTNVTRDHLDVHGDIESYQHAKLRIATDLDPVAVVTGSDDDTCGRLRDWAMRHGRTTVDVGGAVRLAPRADCEPDTPRSRLAAVDVMDPTGAITTATARITVHSPARHDLTNAATAIGMCVAAGLPATDVLAAAEELDLPPGRMQNVATTARGAPVWVDYAHTPAALRACLATLRPAAGRLLVVFGCGGDRDPGKRAAMGRLATRHADVVIVTDDNPRSEPPAEIRAAIRDGCPQSLDVGDRVTAIRMAMDMADGDDVVVLAGRGHEHVQLGGPLRHDDATIVADLASDHATSTTTQTATPAALDPSPASTRTVPA